MTERAGTVFDRVAADYDRVRSGYPAALVDEACARAGLRAGSPVVEIGCGTGKLTVELVERGLAVDAVDPGAAMVDVARAKLPDGAVRFHVVPFEDVELPAGAFDAAFSATAFHWVDPAVGWAKVARLLRPGGVLALLTHVGTANGLGEEVVAAWREVLPEAADWQSRDEATVLAGADERRGDVSAVWTWLTRRELANPEAADLFRDVRVSTVRIDDEDTADGSIAVVRTTSAYLGLDREAQELVERRLAAMFERAGGTLPSSRLAALVTARAVS